MVEVKILEEKLFLLNSQLREIKVASLWSDEALGSLLNSEKQSKNQTLVKSAAVIQSLWQYWSTHADSFLLSDSPPGIHNN